MIAVTRDEGFKYNENLPILKEDGSALSTDYYDIENSAFEDTIIIDRFVLEVDTNELTYQAGDEIELDIDGFIYKNVILQINPTDKKIKLKEELPFEAVLVQVKRDYFYYNIHSDCPNGFYRFKNFETILIKNEFQAVKINYSELIFANKRLMGIIYPGDLPHLNSGALSAIYAEFSYLGDPWNILDLGQMKQLMLRKILEDCEKSNFSGEFQFSEYYNSLKKEITNHIKVPSTNATTVQTSLKARERFQVIYGA